MWNRMLATEQTLHELERTELSKKILVNIVEKEKNTRNSDRVREKDNLTWLKSMDFTKIHETNEESYKNPM